MLPFRTCWSEFTFYQYWAMEIYWLGYRVAQS